MNSSSAGIYGWVYYTSMGDMGGEGKCGWWTSGGPQSITFQKIWIFQVKLQLKYITPKWYSKDTGEVIPVHNKVPCYEEVWESGTVGRGLHSLSIWWRLSGQLHIMATSLPSRFPLPPQNPLDRRLGGPKRWYGKWGREKSLNFVTNHTLKPWSSSLYPLHHSKLSEQTLKAHKK